MTSVLLFMSSLFSSQCCGAFYQWASTLKAAFHASPWIHLLIQATEFDTCVVHLAHFLNILVHFPLTVFLKCIFIFLSATSSTQLEDLSYLDNQRAAGHRGSVRKHTTTARTNDDLKGIHSVLTSRLSLHAGCRPQRLQQTPGKQTANGQTLN